MPPVLRPYRAADAPLLARIDSGLTGVLGPSGTRWHETTAAAGDRLHLVLDDSAATAADPAGYLVLAGPRGAELHRIVLAPGRRGRGLGRSVLDAALGLAGVARPAGTGPGRACAVAEGVRGWPGAGRLWLEVDPANTAALALYRGAGLVELARLPSVPGDPASAPRRLVLGRG